jgi:hypothetical protein
MLNPDMSTMRPIGFGTTNPLKDFHVGTEAWATGKLLVSTTTLQHDKMSFGDDVGWDGGNKLFIQPLERKTLWTEGGGFFGGHVGVKTPPTKEFAFTAGKGAKVALVGFVNHHFRAMVNYQTESMAYIRGIGAKLKKDSTTEWEYYEQPIRLRGRQVFLSPLKDDGRVGVGTSKPEHHLHTEGEMYINGHLHVNQHLHVKGKMIVDKVLSSSVFVHAKSSNPPEKSLILGDKDGLTADDMKHEGRLTFHIGYTLTAPKVYGYLQALEHEKTPSLIALNPMGNHVGIGTRTPRATLEVKGDTLVTGDMYVKNVAKPQPTGTPAPKAEAKPKEEEDDALDRSSFLELGSSEAAASLQQLSADDDHTSTLGVLTRVLQRNDQHIRERETLIERNNKLIASLREKVQRLKQQA